MNSGRYCFSVTAESHAKATIDQLGWSETTYGSVVHAIQPYIKAFKPIGWVVDKVNASRRAAWRKEEEDKA